ncbi:unnamed protein product [Rotaria sp. Silwood1]|nr:unnamed protein product [Rotaria sp. Silwood1]CAF1685544.1 unnamed protein product [Rotaria sp. Silwood1]CAF4848810.1 unnamed protein product [Rotaria sp. Silwood1]CAF5086416.1 unnamed protein product [Rotaria sp. Silwood1]
MYGTYWKYGGNNFNRFPSHWLVNGSSFKVDNYLNFKYGMIYSNSSSQDEDYWQSNVTRRVDSGEIYPYEEIYFKKNTEIPLRFVQVASRRLNLIQVTTNYQVISMGKPDEKYFDSIRKDWFFTCRDVNLGLLYYPLLTNLTLDQTNSQQEQILRITRVKRGSQTILIPNFYGEGFEFGPPEIYPIIIEQMSSFLLFTGESTRCCSGKFSLNVYKQNFYCA